MEIGHVVIAIYYMSCYFGLSIGIGMCWFLLLFYIYLLFPLFCALV